MAVTVLLVYGIRESATRQHDYRHHQARSRRFRHCLRLFHGRSDQLAPVHAERFWRSNEWRRDCLFRLHRLRCRLDHGRGNEKSATRFADRDDRQSDHLHDPLRPDVGRSHRDEEIHDLPRRFGRSGNGLCGEALGAGADQRGSAGRAHLGVARLSARPAAHLHGDGPRRIVAAIFCPDPPALSHARTSPPSGPASSSAASRC